MKRTPPSAFSKASPRLLPSGRPAFAWRSAFALAAAFLFLAPVAWTPAAAQPCDPAALARHVLGAEFLHQKNPARQLQAPGIARAEQLARELGISKPHLPKNKIAAWLAVLEKTHHPGRGEASAKALKNYYRKKYVIRPDDVPESYFELQRRIVRERGQGDIALDSATRSRLAQGVAREQMDSLDRWTDYFLSPDANHYPMWAKVWAFEEMTKLKALEAGATEFTRRTATTTNPFPALNSEALSAVINGVERVIKKESLDGLDPEFIELLKKGSFQQLYAWALRAKSAMAGDLRVTAGQWLKFPKGSSAEPLYESLQCGSTGWCTAGALSTAQSQMKGGDFYVYYSNDASGVPRQPRIAIRMEGGSIAEVRGIAERQHLDPEIAKTGILEAKLKEFGDEGTKYQKRSRDMRRMTEIETKAKSGGVLSPEDLRFLYEIDETIEGFGYSKDPRIAELLKNRDQRSDFAAIFKCKPEQISFTPEEALRGDILFHVGDLDLSHLASAEGLVLPESIRGGLNLRGLRSAKGLVLPKSIQGHLNLGRLTSAEGLVLPKSIRGDLYLEALTSAEGLVIPEPFRGRLLMNGLTSTKGLVLPKSFQGTLRLSGLTSAQGLVLPESFQGELFLNGLTSAEGLVFPESIRGVVDLSGLRSAQGLVLPESFQSDLFLSRLTSAKGLVFPKSFRGRLDLKGLTTTDGLVLPESFQGQLFLNRLTSAKGLVLPKSFNGRLELDGLKSAEGLVLPESMEGKVSLQGLSATSTQNLELPKEQEFSVRLHFAVIQSAKIWEIRRRYPKVEFTQW